MLEIANAARQIRLRQSKVLRRRAQASMVDDGYDIAKLTKFHD
jgi:hypothetical protein